MTSGDSRGAFASDGWDTFVASAKAELAERQRKTLAAFDIHERGEYRWDMDAAEIVFTRDGRRVASATLHYVGAVAGSSGTWLWSWANEAVPEQVKTRMREVREYGREHGFDRLTDAEWPADPSVGADLAAVAAVVLGAEGFFHDHHADLSLYFVLTDFHQGSAAG